MLTTYEFNGLALQLRRSLEKNTGFLFDKEMGQVVEFILPEEAEPMTFLLTFDQFAQLVTIDWTRSGTLFPEEETAQLQVSKEIVSFFRNSSFDGFLTFRGSLLPEEFLFPPALYLPTGEHAQQAIDLLLLLPVTRESHSSRQPFLFVKEPDLADFLISAKPSVLPAPSVFLYRNQSVVLKREQPDDSSFQLACIRSLNDYHSVIHRLAKGIKKAAQLEKQLADFASRCMEGSNAALAFSLTQKPCKVTFDLDGSFSLQSIDNVYHGLTGKEAIRVCQTELELSYSAEKMFYDTLEQLSATYSTFFWHQTDANTFWLSIEAQPLEVVFSIDIFKNPFVLEEPDFQVSLSSDSFKKVFRTLEPLQTFVVEKMKSIAHQHRLPNLMNAGTLSHFPRLHFLFFQEMSSSNLTCEEGITAKEIEQELKIFFTNGPGNSCIQPPGKELVLNNLVISAFFDEAKNRKNIWISRRVS